MAQTTQRPPLEKPGPAISSLVHPRRPGNKNPSASFINGGAFSTGAAHGV